MSLLYSQSSQSGSSSPSLWCLFQNSQLILLLCRIFKIKKWHSLMSWWHCTWNINVCDMQHIKLTWSFLLHNLNIPLVEFFSSSGRLWVFVWFTLVAQWNSNNKWWKCSSCSEYLLANKMLGIVKMKSYSILFWTREAFLLTMVQSLIFYYSWNWIKIPKLQHPQKQT